MTCCLSRPCSILLDNAAKYAGLGSPVVVRIGRAGEEVQVHVFDEGPGLPSTGSEPLFGLFRRAAPGRTGAPRPGAADGPLPRQPLAPAGHGIGLFVARSIVEALGGRIWATNREGSGADVGFALPVATD